jgi:hypothetical protein
MATIMVADEHDEVQRLLSYVVARVGHTPVLWTAAQSDALHGFEALLGSRPPLAASAMRRLCGVHGPSFRLSA